MRRLALFLGLCVAGLVVPWWLFLILMLLYAFRYAAYEVIALGVALDAYVGAPLSWLPAPILYTLASTLIVLCAAWVKPYLVFSDR